MKPAFDINIWSVLLILGIFQGLYITPLLLQRRSRAGMWLTVLLWIMVLNLINYLAVNFRLYREFPHFLQVSLPLIFLIGPAYYFYTRSLLDKSFRILKEHLIHFLPFVLAVLYHSSYYRLPGDIKIKWLDAHMSGDIESVSFEFIAYIGLHVLQTLFYLVLSYQFLKVTDQSTNEQNRKLKSWLQRFSIGFGIYWVLTFAWSLYLMLANAFFIEVDYIFFLCTSLMVNVLAYGALYHNREFSQYLLALFAEKYKRSSLSTEQSSAILKKLITIMEEEKPYLDPQLKISELANKLNTSTNILSQVLNQEMRKNFFEFVNDYRLAEAIRRLSDSTFSHITIIAIAMDAGFNNKNTFNRLFKKQTGLTPSQFVRSH